VKISDLTAPPGAKVDIIIRAKGGQALVDDCVRSIHENTPRELYRLILVDDGSGPCLSAEVDFLVGCAENHGAVTATNLGLGIAFAFDDSAYVLILDNDTVSPQGDTGWLGRMIAELEEGGPRCAAVGATTNFANPPQHILSCPQTYTHDWHDERTQREGVKANPPAPWFVSFAVLLRKSVLREVGLWDQRYNPGNYEDTDYSVALRTRGYEIRVARSVYIHHVGHQTFKDDLAELLATNYERFVEKWGAGRLMDLGLIDPELLKAAL